MGLLCRMLRLLATASTDAAPSQTKSSFDRVPRCSHVVWRQIYVDVVSGVAQAFIRSSFTQQRPSDYDSISRFIRHAGLGHQILRERGDIVREIACDAKTELIEVSMCRKFEE
ncbi:hypothetical protein DGM98_15040 [Xanthomonas citri]|uniref:Uncharacterized protein n=1 Tax=Xanthomonas citri pv. phaseoli var. fuscans TaxID=473423 RepID=A0AB33FCG9_XANCI|nr:hypothetical protein DGM98_15040 [Xanthomonas citri]